MINGMIRNPQRILVTGGCGFIGSAFLRWIIANTEAYVLNLDKLTYASAKESVKTIADDERYDFVHGDICDSALIRHLLNEFQPDTVVNFAAESHVDRSIDGPNDFIQTNIVGTFVLLEEIRKWAEGSTDKFIFLQVSTDEVFGSLRPREGDLSIQADLFCETSRYEPNSPYSATKAAADHLARAWFHTYGVQTLVSNCSNNYGPFQSSEKLIPKTIGCALKRQPIPVYGNGKQVRDWLFVDDHITGLWKVITCAAVGESFAIGGDSEKENIAVVKEICKILDELCPADWQESYLEQIHFVEDRPGHDVRYAIDASKIKATLGWHQLESFSTGLRKTILWYLENREFLFSNLDNLKRRGAKS